MDTETERNRKLITSRICDECGAKMVASAGYPLILPIHYPFPATQTLYRLECTKCGLYIEWEGGYN